LVIKVKGKKEAKDTKAEKEECYEKGRVDQAWLFVSTLYWIRCLDNGGIRPGKEGF
jgi:hypothetical protein